MCPVESPSQATRHALLSRLATDGVISRVLIVDDDEDIRNLLQARLELHNVQVSSVSNGEAALEHLRHHTPDVMFLDLAMSGMTGLEVLQEIRDMDLDVAVILTTAQGSEEVAIEALRTGADDYLPKPFTHRDLKAVVDRTVRKLSLSRHNVLLRRELGVELARAAQVQADLLPGEYPQIIGWDLAARCVPAHRVGGDFYDWQQLTPTLFSVTVGDVMGKGMAAALLMASVRAVLRAVGTSGSPGLAVQSAAASLDGDLTRSGSFATLFHAQLDLVTNQLKYVDAGHGYALLRRADGRVEQLEPWSLPLGVRSNEIYLEGTVELQPNDVLVIYSDGLTEARPDLFRTREQIAEHLAVPVSAATMAGRLIELATAAGPIPDDLTVAVLRRTDPR